MDIQYLIICIIGIVLITLLVIFWPSVKKSVDESQVKFISEKMLPDDIAYTAVPENHIKAIVDQGGNLVKFVMNVKGKSFDKDWNIIDSEIPTPAEYGSPLPDGTLPLITPAGKKTNPDIDHKKSDLTGNETEGMRSMDSLPGINKVLEYPFSWQRINGQVDGEWVIKPHNNQPVKQMYFRAQYVFTFILDTQENFKVRYFIRITTEVRNPKKALFEMAPIGSWIDKLSGMLYNVFEEFTTATPFNEIRKDIAKPDFDITDANGNVIPGTGSVLSKKVFDLNFGNNKGPHTSVVSGVGQEIIGFEIIEFGWPENSPVAKALEQQGIYQKEQEALEVKLASDRLQLAFDTEEIEKKEIAKAAGKLKENEAEKDLIEKKNEAEMKLIKAKMEAEKEFNKELLEKEGGIEAIKWHNVGKQNLTYLNLGGGKDDTTIPLPPPNKKN